MDKNKTKNILFLPGVLHGHFTGDVEIIKLLISLGHNVTCYVLDTFAERLNNIGAKIEVLKIDRSDFDKLPPGVPKIALNGMTLRGALAEILSKFLKDENKYDYIFLDVLYQSMELNKIFKFPISNIITIYPCFCLTETNMKEAAIHRQKILQPINMQYNLNLKDFISAIYEPAPNNKIILTSRLFHFKSEEVDKTFYFIGPSIEERKIDDKFNFKKDPNKMLIFISLGTIINDNMKFYQLCIESFKNSEKYQILMSVGYNTDIKSFKDIPKNFSIYNYVVQSEVLKKTDIFITHGGLNSTQEGLLNHVLLIVIPIVNDSFENAKMVEKLEAGITLDYNKLGVDVLRNAVNDLEINKEKYQKGVEKVARSFEEARSHRKEIIETLLS